MKSAKTAKRIVEESNGTIKKLYFDREKLRNLHVQSKLRTGGSGCERNTGCAGRTED
jgi:hypothetical protein